MTPLETRVATLIAKELGEQHLAANRITAIDPGLLLDDLGVNSIDRVCVAVDLDEDFGIELPDEDVSGWATVADVVASVAKLGAKVGG